MKVRILVEQEARRDDPERAGLPSGAEVDLPAAWARDLLARGDAEPIAQKPSERAETRPRRNTKETR